MRSAISLMQPKVMSLWDSPPHECLSVSVTSHPCPLQSGLVKLTRLSSLNISFALYLSFLPSACPCCSPHSAVFAPCVISVGVCSGFLIGAEKCCRSAVQRHRLTVNILSGHNAVPVGHTQAHENMFLLY